MGFHLGKMYKLHFLPQQWSVEHNKTENKCMFTHLFITTSLLLVSYVYKKRALFAGNMIFFLFKATRLFFKSIAHQNSNNVCFLFLKAYFPRDTFCIGSLACLCKKKKKSFNEKLHLKISIILIKYFFLFYLISQIYLFRIFTLTKSQSHALRVEEFIFFILDVNFKPLKKMFNMNF